MLVLVSWNIFFQFKTACYIKGVLEACVYISVIISLRPCDPPHRPQYPAVIHDPSSANVSSVVTCQCQRPVIDTGVSPRAGAPPQTVITILITSPKFPPIIL